MLNHRMFACTIDDIQRRMKILRADHGLFVEKSKQFHQEVVQLAGEMGHLRDNQKVTGLPCEPHYQRTGRFGETQVNYFINIGQ